MGFSKKNLHQRDFISGLHQQVDISDGTHGAQDLSARNDARLADLNAAIKRDWPKDQISSIPEHTRPDLGRCLHAHAQAERLCCRIQGAPIWSVCRE